MVRSFFVNMSVGTDSADQCVVVAREVEEKTGAEPACHTGINGRESGVCARAGERCQPSQQSEPDSREKQENSVDGHEGQFIELTTALQRSASVLREQRTRVGRPRCWGEPLLLRDHPSRQHRSGYLIDRTGGALDV